MVKVKFMVYLNSFCPLVFCKIFVFMWLCCCCFVFFVRVYLNVSGVWMCS